MNGETSEIPQDQSKHPLYKKNSKYRSAKNLKEVGGLMMSGYRHLEKKTTEAKKTPPPQEVIDSYNQDKSLIETIYGVDHVNSDLVHHGTGAIQYTGDKYQVGTSQEYRYPLDTILKEGLNPHFDTWLESGDVASTSFATSWEYSKWYADKHQDANHPLLWENGNSMDWFSFYLLDTIFHEGRLAIKDRKQLMTYGSQIAKRIISRVLPTMKPLPSHEPNISVLKLKKWVTDVSQDVTPDTTPAAVLKMRTDIPGNFGAVISLDKHELDFFDMGHGGTYEIRTRQNASPKTFKALTVPIGKVDEYKTRTNELGLNIPVFATEAVDYHLSHLPFKELTTNRRTN